VTQSDAIRRNQAHLEVGSHVAGVTSRAHRVGFFGVVGSPPPSISISRGPEMLRPVREIRCYTELKPSLTL
jgi:hypothetical protein